jgi:hypothetical protein
MSVNATVHHESGSLARLWQWGVNLGSDFQFDEAPLNGLGYSIAGGFAYLLMVFSLQIYMKNRQPMQLRPLIALHNLIMCIGSLIMVVGTVVHVWNIVRRFGSRR